MNGVYCKFAAGLACLCGVALFSPAAMAEDVSSSSTAPSSSSPSTTTGTTSSWTMGPTTQAAPGGEVVGYQTIRPNRPLMVTGASMLVGAYVTSVLVGAANNNDADRKLYIPVVGPWLDLGDRQCDTRECKGEDWSKAALIASGVLQGAGTILAVSSVFMPEKVHRTRIAGATIDWKVAPSSMGTRGGGLAAVGRF